jgi:hypothetical protein
MIAEDLEVSRLPRENTQATLSFVFLLFFVFVVVIVLANILIALAVRDGIYHFMPEVMPEIIPAGKSCQKKKSSQKKKIMPEFRLELKCILALCPCQ